MTQTKTVIVVSPEDAEKLKDLDLTDSIVVVKPDTPDPFSREAQEAWVAKLAACIDQKLGIKADYPTPSRPRRTKREKQLFPTRTREQKILERKRRKKILRRLGYKKGYSTVK